MSCTPEGASAGWLIGISRSTVPGRATAALISRPCWFYSYDMEPTRPALWERALEVSGLSWTTVYLCHLSLRQVEWSRRHSPGSPDDARFTAIAEAVLHDCEAQGA